MSVSMGVLKVSLKILWVGVWIFTGVGCGADPRGRFEAEGARRQRRPHCPPLLPPPPGPASPPMAHVRHVRGEECLADRAGRLGEAGRGGASSPLRREMEEWGLSVRAREPG